MSSNVENEYFCDGITEEIINALAKIEQLKVTSRTSSFFFKEKDVPIAEISEKLNVSVVLEGSVRLAGKVVRITAQLIQAKEDFHFWSETWDRNLENIFEIQDEISLLIADKIRENFGHFEFQDHLVKRQTEDINAYEYSLMAKYHKNKWNADDIQVAEEYYLKALDLDTNHVESIIGLSDVYSFMAMTGILSLEEGWMKSNELVNKAMELDPSNPEIYYQKANGAFFTECNFAASMQMAKKAIQLKPNYVEAQQFMSFLNILSGNKDAAKEHLDIALGIDPLSQETLFFKAYFDYMTRDYEAAYQQLSSCLEVNPGNIPSHAVMTLCLLKLGRYDEVIHYFDQLEVPMVKGERLGAIGIAYVLKGDKVNSEKYLDLLKEDAKLPDGFTSESFLFTMYAVMGEIEKAFEWVASAVENKATLLMIRYPDPMVDVLRTDERYQKYSDIIFKTDEVTSVSADKKALLDDASAENYRKNLLAYIEENQPYLDAGLTLRSLASQIELHPNKLSWLINEMHEQNFNQFINNYRIEHFKKLALKPDSEQFSILGLAYDSGFNSKTVFNTYFKKSTGQSPKAWIQSQESL